MRISVEVAHPAHVHYWKNVIKLLKERGHSVEIFAREKEQTLQMLRALGFSFEAVGASKPTLTWKAIDLPVADLKLLSAARKKGIQFMLSTGIPGSAHASRILGIPHVSLIDTEIAHIGRLLAEPFSDAVCTPACFTGKVDPAKHIRFKGYLELMYLHPTYFTPDPSVLDLVGLGKGERFAIVRFSSWDSSHDIGKERGALATDEERYQVVKELSQTQRVFLTSEIPLPQSFREFHLDLPPERFHDLLACASIYVGEGAKVASEAGVLGVPWVYLSRSRRGYLDDQEKRYQLGRTVGTPQEARNTIEQLMSEQPGLWQERRRKLLDDSVDVTMFMTDLVDGWPDSRTRLLRETEVVAD